MNCLLTSRLPATGLTASEMSIRVSERNNHKSVWDKNSSVQRSSRIWLFIVRCYFPLARSHHRLARSCYCLARTHHRLARSCYRLSWPKNREWDREWRASEMTYHQRRVPNSFTMDFPIPQVTNVNIL